MTEFPAWAGPGYTEVIVAQPAGAQGAESEVPEDKAGCARPGRARPSAPGHKEEQQGTPGQLEGCSSQVLSAWGAPGDIPFLLWGA